MRKHRFAGHKIDRCRLKRGLAIYGREIIHDACAPQGLAYSPLQNGIHLINNDINRDMRNLQNDQIRRPRPRRYPRCARGRRRPVQCVPGESYLPLTDTLIDFPNMQLVVCRHEGAGFMAAAHARLRNEPGVCIIGQGPGAMNTAIALHVAYHDAEPVVFLVGQAELDELGRNALQEMNYSKTFSDTAKMVIEVVDPSRIAESVARAFHVAERGNSGPVVVVCRKICSMGRLTLSRGRGRRRWQIPPTMQPKRSICCARRKASSDCRRPCTVAHAGRFHPICRRVPVASRHLATAVPCLRQPSPECGRSPVQPGTRELLEP